MKRSDVYRKSVINQILTEGHSSNNRVSFHMTETKILVFIAKLLH